MPDEAPVISMQGKRGMQRGYPGHQPADRSPAMTAALASMTGFARSEGAAAGLSWAWELRSVNGRGLDLRLRLPPGWDQLEPALRQAVGRVLRRGNVTANLTVKRDSELRLVADPAA